MKDALYCRNNLISDFYKWILVKLVIRYILNLHKKQVNEQPFDILHNKIVSHEKHVVGLHESSSNLWNINE